MYSFVDYWQFKYQIPAEFPLHSGAPHDMVYHLLTSYPKLLPSYSKHIYLADKNYPLAPSGIKLLPLIYH